MVVGKFQAIATVRSFLRVRDMQEQRNPRRWLTWLLVGLVLLLVAYPLSLGPVCWYFDSVAGRQGSLFRFAQYVYAPCYDAYETSPKIVRDIMDWYLNLWGATC